MNHSNPYISKQKCQWCFRLTDKIIKGKSCEHSTCNLCSIKDKICKSKCPICWEENITRYIHGNNICAVCCTGMKYKGKLFACSRGHFHCSECTSNGCILCHFHQLKASNDKDDLPKHYSRTMFTCQRWQSGFEKTLASISKDWPGLQVKKESSTSIEYDNESEKTSGSNRSKNVKTDSVKSEEIENCTICLEILDSSFEILKHCKHRFHSSCIDTWFQSSGKQSCPTCGHVYGISKGPQPSNGQMNVTYLPTYLPGFELIKWKYGQGPTIEISYIFPSGLQGPLNPHPNQPYGGTVRKAYLPNNEEGKEILSLLKRAFEDQHIFTVGRSTTTGQDNVVTWNDVHHKTSIHGGPERFGYPDPTYLLRVRQELADKGYK